MRVLARLILALALLGIALPAWGAEEGPPQPTAGERDILSQIFAFLYTIAHGIGQLVVKAIQAIIPEAQVLDTLIDPIGVLALLTIFLAIYELAKKITWIIVIVGWALIVIKVVLVVLKIG